MPQDRAPLGLFAVFRNLTIARKLSVTVAVALLAMLGLCLVGVEALRAAGDDNASLLRADAAVRSALEADMMHDAVRADVLQSMLVTGPEYEAAQADLADHTGTLRDSLDAVTDAEVAPAVDLAVADVAPAVGEYIRLAQQISTQAGSDPGSARAAYPEFVAAFKHLETRLPTVGDALLVHATEVADSTTHRRAVATRLLIGTGLACALIVVLLGTLVSRSVSRPLQQAVQVLEGLADGRLDLRLDVATKDEVGQLAAAVNRATGRLRSAMGAMGTNAQGLASSAQELSAVSTQMKGAAEQSATQARSVSAAAGQVSTNVQTVVAGTALMSESIRAIAASTVEAAGVAHEAVQVAESARLTVATLGESSVAIGNVVKAINAIAGQTNLLALNATIEAARAGEAGKGFAVVAGEVKELARETSRATEDISARIEAIQANTSAAEAAIAQISTIIQRINATQATIASAIQEQTATTNEMSRSVSEAATGATHIAATITSVARTASDADAAARSTSHAANEFARMAADTKQLTGQFQC